MRYLIFSDVHGNLFGLQRVLQFARREGIDKLYCLGDLVGYHGYPAECIDRIRGHGIPSVKGNHEGLLLGELSGFSRIAERAQHSLKVTRGLLTTESVEFLRQLPFSIGLSERILLLHANFWDVKQTINTIEKARRNFEAMQERNLWLTFFGHTHRPEAFIADKDLQHIQRVGFDHPIDLDEERYYLINPGTVGVRRHGLPYSFVVYDETRKQVQYVPFELTDAEVQRLSERDKALFGGFSLRRLPAQIRERVRRLYYALSR